ncbi:MAG: MarR family transcriptional regulator [Lachnospiraceae bacterium]|jgi:DNA-binding MarR family transcriptional regulator|nr:MarR family transcriptional regulator [Lachnospiraceae bacterium]
MGKSWHGDGKLGQKTPSGGDVFPSPGFVGLDDAQLAAIQAPDERQLRSFMNVFLIANRLQALMDRELEDITTKQWIAMIMLSTFPEPPLLHQLANRCGITHQSAMQLVKRLQEKGYVTTAADPHDKRALRICTTAKCKRWGTSFAAAHAQSFREIFSALSEEEMAVFAQAQQKLYNRLMQ